MNDKLESKLYYFYTVGCGFCKKADPIVEELNKEGHNILRLDLAEKENKEIVEDLKKKYNIQCGTPLFIDAETGNYFCGYREKDIVLKWVNGEKIPPPPRPKSPMPRPPFHGSDESEDKKWKKEYKEWVEENSHLPNLKTADEFLAMPRPKSQPPQMIRPNSTEKEKEEWKEKYEEWTKENNHLPNLMNSQTILERMRNPQQPMQPPQMGNQNLDQRIISVENKLNRLMAHLGVK